MRYIVRRGAALGATLFPHRHKDGRFVASPSRYRKDYRYFGTAVEAYQCALTNGWGIRMSANGKGAPSLISADRCER